MQWCPWSRRLAPVLDEVSAVTAGTPNVRIARVDCTDPSAMMLCMGAHIQAYPTVILYRGGQGHSDIHYHGDRTKEAILSFLVAAEQDEELGHEAEGQGNAHGADAHAHAERLQRELGLIPPMLGPDGQPIQQPQQQQQEEGHGHAHGSGGSSSSNGGDGSQPAPTRDPADPGRALALIEAMHKAGMKAPGDALRALVGGLVGNNATAAGGNGTAGRGEAGSCEGDKEGKEGGKAPRALGVAGGYGCQVAGYLEVARVPGSFAIAPVTSEASGLSLEERTLNVTHVVHELFFSAGGKRLTQYQLSRLPPGTADELHRQAGAVYVSPPDVTRVSHEHYISVVGSQFVFGPGHEVETYRYSVHSHAVSSAAGGGEGRRWWIQYRW